MNIGDLLIENSELKIVGKQLAFTAFIVAVMLSLVGCDNNSSLTSAEKTGIEKNEAASNFELYLRAKNITGLDDAEKLALKIRFLERVELARTIENKNVVSKDVLNAEVADFRRELLIKMYFNEISQNSIDEESLRKYYEENIAKFRTTQANISHILLEDNSSVSDKPSPKDLTAVILEQLKKGVDFGLLAKKYSIDKKTANRNGEMGWVDLSKIDSAMARALNVMQPGDISQPITTVFGTHIIKLHENIKKSERSFDSVKEKIRHDVATNLYASELERLKEQGVSAD